MKNLLLFFLLFITGSTMSQPPPYFQTYCTDYHKFELIDYFNLSFYPDQSVGTFQYLKYERVPLMFIGFPIIEMISIDGNDTLRNDLDKYNYVFAGVGSDIENSELCDALSQVFFIDDEMLRKFKYDLKAHPERITIARHPEIFKWPGRDNPHFKFFNIYNRDLSEGIDYAPFVDNNGDGIYNPIDGDYPSIQGKAMAWNIRTVSPDYGFISRIFPSITYKSSFIFPFDEKDESDAPTIMYYKSKLKINGDLGSFSFGLYLDPDLGCSYDDYYAYNPDENYVIINNVDSLDGDQGNSCTGGDKTFRGDPPLFIIKNIRALGGVDLTSSENKFYASGKNCDVENFQLLLRGEAFPGQQYRLNAEDACSGPFDIITRHSYHGNPADTSSACMINRENFEGEDIRFSIAYDKIEDVTADKTYEFVLGLSVIETEYKKRIDFNDTTIINRVRLMDELYEDFPTSTEEFEDIARKDLHVFPNPSNSKIYINARMKSDIEIYNIQGQKVLEINKYTGLPIDISHLNTGLYFLTERNDSGLRSVKFVKGK